MIHLAGSFNEFFICTFRCRVAAVEFQGTVIISDLVEAQSSGLSFRQFADNRSDILQDLSAVIGYHFLVIVKTVHSDVAQFGKVLIAQFPGHLVSYLDQFVINAVKLRFMFLIELQFGIHALLSGLTVLIVGELADG